MLARLGHKWNLAGHSFKTVCEFCNIFFVYVLADKTGHRAYSRREAHHKLLQTAQHDLISFNSATNEMEIMQSTIICPHITYTQQSNTFSLTVYHHLLCTHCFNALLVSLARWHLNKFMVSRRNSSCIRGAQMQNVTIVKQPNTYQENKHLFTTHNYDDFWSDLVLVVAELYDVLYLIKSLIRVMV